MNALTRMSGKGLDSPQKELSHDPPRDDRGHAEDLNAQHPEIGGEIGSESLRGEGSVAKPADIRSAAEFPAWKKAVGSLDGSLTYLDDPVATARGTDTGAGDRRG